MNIEDVVFGLSEDQYKLSVFVGFIHSYLEDNIGKEGADSVIKTAYKTAKKAGYSETSVYRRRL